MGVVPMLQVLSTYAIAIREASKSQETESKSQSQLETCWVFWECRPLEISLSCGKRLVAHQGLFTQSRFDREPAMIIMSVEWALTRTECITKAAHNKISKLLSQQHHKYSAE